MFCKSPKKNQKSRKNNHNFKNVKSDLMIFLHRYNTISRRTLLTWATSWWCYALNRLVKCIFQTFKALYLCQQRVFNILDIFNKIRKTRKSSKISEMSKMTFWATYIDINAFWKECSSKEQVIGYIRFWILL